MRLSDSNNLRRQDSIKNFGRSNRLSESFTRKNVVSSGQKADWTDIVVVSHQGLDTLVRGEVPQLDRHVGATRRQQLTLTVKRQVLHRICVPLQSPLKIARFKVPDLDCGVLGRRDHEAEDGMEEHAGDWCTVAGQGILFWRARDPFGGGPFFSRRRTGYEFFFCFS